MAVALAPTTRAQPPVITEIFYNAPGAIETPFEWFEIYNPGPGDLALGGLVVQSGLIGGASYLGSIPLATPDLPAGTYGVLASELGLGTDPLCGTAGVQAELEGNFELANSPNSSFVALFPEGTTQPDIDGGATALDWVGYRNTGFPASVNGVSISLADLAGDNTDGSNWALVPSDGSCDPFAVVQNVPMYGNPGQPHDHCNSPTTPVCLCGDLSWIGECSGDELRFCADLTEIITIDCPAEYGPDNTCGLLDCTDLDCLGYYCVARSGQACDQLWCDATIDPDSPLTPLGCLSGICSGSTTCDPYSFDRICSSDVLEFCQAEAEVEWAVDCSAGSAPYFCGVTSSGDEACLGLEGGNCDIPHGRECAPGLICLQGICEPKAGVPVNPSEPCAGLTQIGECDGDTLRYCADGGSEVLAVDCPTEFGSSATCGLLDCTDPDCLGYYCVSQQNEDCGGLWCDKESMLGCLWGICDISAPCDPGSFDRSCNGDRLTYCHPEALEEWNLDCSEGGTEPFACALDYFGKEACVGLEGAACEHDHANGRRCSRGLVCLGGVCTLRGNDPQLGSYIFSDGFESGDTTGW